MLKLRMLPAMDGDFIWISYGKDSFYHILIDGGPELCSSAYEEVLNEIYDSGESIQALILSHIDNDHIMGALGGIVQTDKKVLQQILHNIYFNTRRGIAAREQVPVGNPDWESNIVVHKRQKGYSVGAAISLIQVLEEKGLTNRLHEYIIAGDELWLEGGAMLKVISPGAAELQELAKKWKHVEEQHPIGYGSRTDWRSVNLKDLQNAETACDTSVTNRSSIAVLFEYNDVRIPLLADAVSSVCLSGLKMHGITEPYHVSAFKLPHHGSSGNTTDELLRILPTDNYLLSTNGARQRAPSKAAIARLLKSEHTAGMPIQLLCNYDWWETAYHRQFFSEKDEEDYLRTKLLLPYVLYENGISFEGGLIHFEGLPRS